MGRYAQIERERRFLMAAPPTEGIVARREITDRYIRGTRLRLRCVRDLETGERRRKLTQKLPADQPGHVRGLITTMYLASAEYDLLAALPAAVLSKTRLTVPPLGIDVFDSPLRGLIIAEAEFGNDEEALAFRAPSESVAEVTDDPNLTGAALARTHLPALQVHLAGYGIELGPQQ